MFSFFKFKKKDAPTELNRKNIEKGKTKWKNNKYDSI